MEVYEALQIILDLAKDNMLDFSHTIGDDRLKEMAIEQSEAEEVVFEYLEHIKSNPQFLDFD